ncbi:SPFH domain-containing protein [Pinirhizobacter sp.]|jgi:regulator of protease activity HflC (stomatin/prohibitin superfamily)|uniref:SPFH domain-containing protein n=1 Tax=Pinirhizobacter sp. TaxID=2950432 RepID=UPI002F41482A
MFTSAFFLLSITFAAFAALSIRRIPEGQVHSLYRLGKPARLLGAGTHFVLPLADRVVHKIQLGGQTLNFSDHVDVRDVQGTVYWQVLEPERADLVIDQADELIRERLRDALRTDAANDADFRAMNARLKLAANAFLRERGMLVTRVDLSIA